MAKKKKEITDIDRKRRLQSIQNLHEKILKNEDVSKFPRLDQVAYILWRYPNTRNSDRTHAIQYYKTFYPEYVKDDKITFEDVYILPKMYDLQRDRAKIQNTEELFPASIRTKKKRKETESEYHQFYLSSNFKKFSYDANYYLYLDESGKNDTYFTLGGLLINSDEKKESLAALLVDIREKLNKKYQLEIKEWKYTNINGKNKDYYLELLDEFKNTNMNFTYVSAILENSGLSSNSKKNKTKELLKFVIKDCIDTLTLYTCRSSYENVVSNLYVTLDNDGAGVDILQKEQIKTEIQSAVGLESRYFSVVQDISWEDSKLEDFIQIADMYASSLNNIYSDLPADSDKAKAKKEFATKMIEMVGIETIYQSRGNNKNFEFINKCIYQEEIPEELKK